MEAGPFVLGALSPPERARYQVHSSTCVRCRADLAELAGLRALLSQVPVHSVVGPVPAAGEDAVGQAVSSPRPRRARSYRRWSMMWWAAVGLAVGCLAVGVWPVASGAERPSQIGPVMMRPPGSFGPLRGMLAYAPDGRGTWISVVCTWSPLAVDRVRSRLSLTVTGKDRHRWIVDRFTTTDTIPPVSGWVALEPSRIARIDIAPDTGASLLTYQP